MMILLVNAEVDDDFDFDFAHVFYFDVLFSVDEVLELHFCDVAVDVDLVLHSR